MLADQMDRLPVSEDQLVLGRGYWGPNSPSNTWRSLNNLCQAGWYYRQIELMAAGESPQTTLSPWWAMLAHLGKDMGRAILRKVVAGA